MATGFACFAMSALWIRYEMRYDGFHANADRLYCVNILGVLYHDGTMSRESPQPLARYLKATFPEIAGATSLTSPDIKMNLESDGVKHKVDILYIDSSFLSMFNIKIVEGSMDFLIPGSRNIAITREKASQMFGVESPIGKTIKLGADHTICAVVTGFSKHSNYPFDLLLSSEVNTYWIVSQAHTLIEIVSGIDVDALKKKLSSHTIEASEFPRITKMTLTPLTTVHYKDPHIKRDVQFQHIILFAVAGSLLIVCTLFNYLTLFVSRFRIRRKEFALRTVYGASGRSLFAMLSTEFALSMIVALLFGLFLIQLFIEPFREMSGTRLALSAIYLESAAYIAAVIVVALSAFVMILALFRRRTLNANIHGNKKIFRKTSIVVQLIVSIVFAFCTAVILKQVYYLRNTDLGFASKNRGSVFISTDPNNVKALNYKIRQIPEINETVAGYPSLLPTMTTIDQINKWDGKPENVESMKIQRTVISEEFVRFYELQLAEGEMINETWATKDVMINESAAKTFGWETVVGKSINTYRVRGMLKNIYNMSPTVPAQPNLYISPKLFIWTDQNGINHTEDEYQCILFRYHEGAWKICKEKITKIVEAEFPNTHTSFYNAEEEYDKYLKSENTLTAILTIISIICIIVCIFGFVSMVSLTCEERRKEIAIRRINGATVKDILDLFFKEHLTLLAVGASIAFPIGYIVMRRWLEQYVVQTEISAWIYISILFTLILVIVLCVGGKVYRTSSENPINAIK
jgi:hypothetical protein